MRCSRWTLTAARRWGNASRGSEEADCESERTGSSQSWALRISSGSAAILTVSAGVCVWIIRVFFYVCLFSLCVGVSSSPIAREPIAYRAPSSFPRISFPNSELRTPNAESETRNPIIRKSENQKLSIMESNGRQRLMESNGSMQCRGKPRLRHTGTGRGCSPAVFLSDFLRAKPDSTLHFFNG